MYIHIITLSLWIQILSEKELDPQIMRQSCFLKRYVISSWLVVACYIPIISPVSPLFKHEFPVEMTIVHGEIMMKLINVFVY